MLVRVVAALYANANLPSVSAKIRLDVLARYDREEPPKVLP
jgi:hypothetical protein